MTKHLPWQPVGEPLSTKTKPLLQTSQPPGPLYEQVAQLAAHAVTENAHFLVRGAASKTGLNVIEYNFGTNKWYL
jgi:hypothetical protein